MSKYLVFAGYSSGDYGIWHTFRASYEDKAQAIERADKALSEREKNCDFTYDWAQVVDMNSMSVIHEVHKSWADICLEHYGCAGM